MRFAKILAAVSLVVSATSAQTLYLAGDSTMANDGGEVYKGWGTQISKYVGLTVVNDATAGRSARSYTDEGRCQSSDITVFARDLILLQLLRLLP
jgi:rhamnogalacturonan acetylesterase